MLCCAVLCCAVLWRVAGDGAGWSYGGYAPIESHHYIATSTRLTSISSPEARSITKLHEILRLISPSLPLPDGSHRNIPAARTPHPRVPRSVDEVAPHSPLQCSKNTRSGASLGETPAPAPRTMSPPVSSLPDAPGPLWRFGSSAIMGMTGVLCKVFLYGFNRVETQGLDNFLRILDERKRDGRKRGLVTACNHISV